MICLTSILVKKVNNNLTHDYIITISLLQLNILCFRLEKCNLTIQLTIYFIIIYCYYNNNNNNNSKYYDYFTSTNATNNNIY